MNNTFISFTVALTMLAVTSQASLLGVAGEYNAFAFGNINVKWADSQGKVAGAGDVTIESYGIGEKADASLYSLVGGGNVNFTNGTIFNGGLFAGGNATLTNATINGDVSYSGTLFNNNSTIRGDVVAGSEVGYIDFNEVYQSLSATSSSLAATQANGTANNSYGTLALSGTESVNYFSLASTELSSINGLVLNLAEDAVAIVNVSGKSASVKNFGFSGNFDSKNVLFNFFEAEDLTIGGVGFKGSILASDADIAFNSGHIDGNMIGGSISGYGQFHNELFSHNPPPPQDVPEPSSIAMFFLGSTTFLMALKRKKR